MCDFPPRIAKVYSDVDFPFGFGFPKDDFKFKLDSDFSVCSFIKLKTRKSNLSQNISEPNCHTSGKGCAASPTRLILSLT